MLSPDALWSHIPVLWVSLLFELANLQVPPVVICEKRVQRGDILGGWNHEAGVNVSNAKFGFSLVLKSCMGTYARSASVHLQSSHGGHQHHHVGHQAGCSAFDVEEFLHPNVSPKASFGHCGEASWKWAIIFQKQQQALRSSVTSDNDPSWKHSQSSHSKLPVRLSCRGGLAFLLPSTTLTWKDGARPISHRQA